MKSLTQMSDPRVNPADQNNRAIVNAAKDENPEIVKLLMSDPRVDPTDRDSLAILIAVSKITRNFYKLFMKDSSSK